MAFTYSGDPSTSERDAVRFLIQDIDPITAMIQDAEIDFILDSVAHSIYQASHDLCYVLASQFAKLADTSKSVGDMSLSVTYSNRASEYRTLAERFLELEARRVPPIPRFSENALKRTADRDLSNLTTDFFVGQTDYQGNKYSYNPLAQA